ncbi:MAG: aminopeptidase P family protein [Planctomycetota bacterium]|nr:MAG: aminopeptidase P family protein [Planctomycetota bacterium]
MSDRFAARRDRFWKLLRDTGVDAFLVSNEMNVSWLTGFTGDSSWLVMSAGQSILVSDSRYETQIAEECPGLELLIRRTDQKLPQVACDYVNSRKARRLGVEGHVVTLETREALVGGLAAADLIPVSMRIENDLRSIKDAEEISETRKAVNIAGRGFDFLRATLRPDQTERDAAYELEHAMRKIGAESVAFTPIIGSGDRAALPHYRPGDRKIGDSDLLLIDWGAQPPSRYKSDLTRTLVFGKPSSKFAKVYNTVLEAQKRAIALIRPGARCGDVDRAARGYIADQGYGKRFGHGLGHGIGLNIHEQPRFAPGSDTELKPGMIVTVEPGIYLPDWGGVRIEDDVLVTKDGCEVLSAHVPKELDQMITHW